MKTQAMRRLGCAWACMLGVLCLGCDKHGSSKDGKAASPAKTEKLPLEIELARVTLTSAAEQRLGIARASLGLAEVERRRWLSGELMIPTGKIIQVTAPVAGTVSTVTGRAMPMPGVQLAIGDDVLTIAPFLSPERDVPTPAERVQMANSRATIVAAQTVAEGDVARSRAEVEAAQIALRRAEQLFRDKAGSARAVDDAKAQANIAAAGLQAATDRLRRLTQLAQQLDERKDGAEASLLVVTSPQPGVLRNLSVTTGQTVSAGSLLFDVADLSTLWVRVPIYSGIVDEIDPIAPARIIADKAARREQEQGVHEAHPVVGPPTADPINATVDRLYAVANGQRTFVPGQRVGVELTLRGAAQAPVVPRSAVLYDIYGGTWVYTPVAPHAYERRRVQVDYAELDRLVLKQLPAGVTEVVTDGAAELFGIEFGAGK